MRRGPQTVLCSVLLFATSLLYRATFITQGYNATDEGWLQSLGARIVSGQMPYRDFNFGLPPLSIYKEAALIRLLGGEYGILASRWIFNVEVSVASVLAFLILVRYVHPTLALLAVLPTCFFSTILFYFANYSYDGEVLSLFSLALLVHARPGRRLLGFVGGLAAGLAFMAKPTFLGLLPIVTIAIFANMLGARRARTEAPAGQIDWASLGGFIAGFVASSLAALAYFALAGAAGSVIDNVFVVPRQSYPIPLGFVIWQDLPQRMLFWPNVSGYLGAALVLLLVVRAKGIPDALRGAAAGALVLLLVVRALPSSDTGLPTARQSALLLTLLAALYLLNGLALIVSILARGRPGSALFPPELPVLALGMQYIAQFNAAGVAFSYYGAFLSVAVAILLLQTLVRDAPNWSRNGLSIGVATLSPVLFGLSIAAAGTVITHGVVFRDGPRSELSATFATPALRGLSTLPPNESRLDGLVAIVKSRTAPGDPILVLPDFPVLYFLTDRRNPTRIGWYETPQVTVTAAQQAVYDMQRDPPKLVVLQRYDEGDFRRTGAPLDYEAIPQLLPVYRYIVANYRQVDTVGDLQIYIPKVLPA